MLPQACVERDDGGRRDLLAPSINEVILSEQPEHTQTSRETCGDCAGRGAGWATCDELEMRQARIRLRTPAASWYAATDLELPSLKLILFLKTLETSLGHCFGRLRLN